MIETLAHRVILAEGWRRAALAFAAGAIGALAMPPFGFWPALALSLTCAVWLIDGCAAGQRFAAAATLRSAAWVGWCWGFGYFVASLWWLGAAFLVDPGTFGWLMPFGVVGLPAICAVYPALGFALARLIWSRGAARIFALAFGLGVSEWLRGHLFTGFPWNTLGMALGQTLWLMQGASLFGLYGLTFLAVLILASPATLGTGHTRAGRWGPVTVAIAALVALAGFGALRLAGGTAPPVAGVKLRIMQPNLAQDAKFGPDNGREILNHYLALSDRSTSPTATGLANVTHLIWPESAFPFLLNREPYALAEIGKALRPGSVLITGAAREGEPAPDGRRRFYNAIEVVDHDGAVAATYDKLHLVPFGEYVPAFVERLLGTLGIRQFVQIPGGFTAGDHRTALDVPGLPPVAATICYEAIFPGDILPDGARPGLIINVTNDGWFGDTPGPRQHFAQARLRAVETGLPLVRAANTGISAVVDPYGRVTASLPVGVEGVIDASLPSIADRTIFDRFGAIIVYGLCTVCGALALVGLRRRYT